MAIFSLQISPISRGHGRSSVGAAAYIGRERMRDERTGERYDYRRRAGLVHRQIVLPAGAEAHRAAWVQSPQALWNHAEAAERRRDARVALEYVISLPHELDAAQRLALAQRFAADVAERSGVVVELAVHTAPPGGDARNHHAHLLATTREFGADGLGRKSVMHWSDNARRAQGLPRMAQEFKEIRRRWSALTNAALQAAELSVRVDHRTLAEQGIDRPASVHLGPAITHIERNGGHSYVLERIRLEQAAERAAAERVRPAPSLPEAAPALGPRDPWLDARLARWRRLLGHEATAPGAEQPRRTVEYDLGL